MTSSPDLREWSRLQARRGVLQTPTDDDERRRQTPASVGSQALTLYVGGPIINRSTDNFFRSSISVHTNVSCYWNIKCPLDCCMEHVYLDVRCGGRTYEWRYNERTGGGIERDRHMVWQANCQSAADCCYTKCHVACRHRWMDTGPPTTALFSVHTHTPSRYVLCSRTSMPKLRRHKDQCLTRSGCMVAITAFCNNL